MREETKAKIRSIVWDNIAKRVNEKQDKEKCLKELINFFEEYRGFTECEWLVDVREDEDAKIIIEGYGVGVLIETARKDSNFFFVGCNFDKPTSFKSSLESIAKDALFEFIESVEEWGNWTDIDYLFENVFDEKAYLVNELFEMFVD